MTRDDNPARSEFVRVIVQLVVDRHTSPAQLREITESLAGLGFQPDRAAPAVHVPAPKERRTEIAKAGKRVVVVRGRVPRENVAALRGDRRVLGVSADARLEPFFAARRLGVDCATGGDPIGDVRMLAKKLEVDRVWQAGCRGQGVVVGVVDAGITARGRIVGPGEDAEIPRSPGTGRVNGGWPDDWGTTAVGWSQHGNQMAFDVQAVAPDVSLWDIRIWEPGADFGAYVFNAVAAYRAAIDHYREHGVPHVLTNSWGLYDSATDPVFAFDPDSALARMVEEALDAGILVLFAAGNCGETCPSGLCGAGDTGPGQSILGPNGHPRVMTVGAADLNDDLCGYTSQGPAALPPHAPKPDFCGYTRFEGFFPSAGWTIRDFDGGTSSATAVAAGVVALLKQQYPDLTQEQAKEALQATAEDIWIPGFDMDSGAGVIRARAAFDFLS